MGPNTENQTPLNPLVRNLKDLFAHANELDGKQVTIHDTAQILTGKDLINNLSKELKEAKESIMAGKIEGDVFALKFASDLLNIIAPRA